MLEKRKITSRQLKYLNILLSKCFEGHRMLYLRLFYKVGSSKELSLEQASEIIDKFVPSNIEVDLNISEAFEKIYEYTGQKKLI